MTTREIILQRVESALRHAPRTPMPVLPGGARLPNDVETQIEMTLAAIELVGGKTRRVKTPDDFQAALTELVQAENVKQAMVWQTAEFHDLGVVDVLSRLGVEIVSPFEDKHMLARCDLGITGADFAIPSTGTLILRTTPDQPQSVSLLPRVHLALFHSVALRADFADAFAEIKSDKHAVMITGPSRTADIEKVLAIGVHGPKVFYAWCCE